MQFSQPFLNKIALFLCSYESWEFLVKLRIGCAHQKPLFMRIPKMPQLFHFGPSRVELWPSKHLKSNLRRHLSLTRVKIFLLYFTTLFKPKNTLSVVLSIGGTTAALRQMIMIMIVIMIMISLNMTWYKEPPLTLHCSVASSWRQKWFKIFSCSVNKSVKSEVIDRSLRMRWSELDRARAEWM